MEINELLKTISNVDDYFTITRTVTNKKFNSKILLNISTVLALKQIRSIEVEYFAKSSENGAAIKIIELMFTVPPCEAWSIRVGRELILLIQYWLDAIRKHLIIHNINWWIFLNVLLNLIKDIQLKIPGFNDILTKEISECLFDLATRSEPNFKQRDKIICCLNRICAKSSREIRINMKEKIDSYLVNLSAIMATCGDFCTQFSIMEILLRWLCNHQDLAVRKEASTKWFPSTLYSEQAVAIFLKRPWFNLFEDVRAFLNAHNDQGEHIISVLCKKLFVGDVKLIYDTDKINYYIDLNSESKCISLILNSKLQQILGRSLSDTFVIHEDNTRNIQMFRKSPNIIIMISIVDPPKMHPSNILNGKYNVHIEISFKSDVTKVNRALRNIFHTKYELLMEIEDQVQILSLGTSITSRTAIEDNSSLAANIQRKKHSGLMVWGRNIASIQSASSTSTSSLAMLREKLKAYPRCNVKEKIRIQALPSLSKVSELTETYEDCINLTQSTLKLRSYGICYINKKKHLNTSSCDNSSNKSDKKLSPSTINYDNSISLLSNITSAGNSIINDTLEHVGQANSNINTNVLNAFAREALHSQQVKTSNDTGPSNTKVIDNRGKKIFYNENVYNCAINNNSEKLNPSVVEDTSNALKVNERKTKKNDLSKEESTRKEKRTIISNTTSNESNFEVVEDTPNVMHVTEKVTKNNIDNRAFERLFTEHLIDNKNNESLVINPSLARKINTTSSESSELLDIEPISHKDFNFDVSEIELNECPNNAIDAAFNAVDKYCDDQKICNMNDTGLQISSKENECGSEEKLVKPRKTSKGIKSNVKSKSKNQKQSSKLHDEPVIENIGFQKNYEMPLTRRKRKLYSAKDDDKVVEVNFTGIEKGKDTHISFQVCEEVFKSAATSYTELENIRRKSQQRIRNKKSMETLMSPKTRNMNVIFDNLIKIDKKISIAKKINPEQYAIYNFTSDSDQDNDFNSQRVQAINSTSVSVKLNNIQSRRGRKIVNCETMSTKKKPNRKNTKQAIKGTIRKRVTKPKTHLIDEHVRDYNSSEILNTTYVMEVPNDEIKEPEPILNLKPQMEVDIDSPQTELLTKAHKPIKSKLSLNRRNKPENSHISTRESEISLPDLNVEKVEIPRDNEEVDLKKLKDIYKNIAVQDVGTMAQNVLVDLDQNNNSPSVLNNTYESNKSKTNLITRKAIKKNKTKLDTLKDKVNKRARKKKSNIIKNNTKLKTDDKSIIELDKNKVTENKYEINQIKTLNASNLSVAGTIATFGNSSITAHGSESPPNTKQLNRTIQSRGLETRDMNKTKKEYFETLIESLNTNIEYKSSSEKNDGPIIIDSHDAKNLDSVKNPSFQVNISPSVSIARLSTKELSRWLPPRHNSIFGSNQSSNSSTRISKTGDQIDDNSTKLDKSLDELRKTRKTIISPIKIYDKEKVTSVSPQENNYVDRIRNIMGTTFCEPINVNQKPRYNLRSSQQETNSYQESIELPNIKPGTSSLKSSSDESNVFVNKIKRKLPPIIEKSEKKIGILSSVEESVNQRQMSAIKSTSGSSIQDWFKRNDDDKQTELQNHFLEDTLKPIIEKLDTTFDEIHHMTSRKFVNLFVDEENGFDNLKQELRELNQNMFIELFNIFKKKTEESEKRVQEKINQFMEKQKKRAQEFIIEDSTKKKLMVKLLKEDLEAVLKHQAHINKINRVDPVFEDSD